MQILSDFQLHRPASPDAEDRSTRQRALQQA